MFGSPLGAGGTGAMGCLTWGRRIGLAVLGEELAQGHEVAAAADVLEDELFE